MGKRIEELRELHKEAMKAKRTSEVVAAKFNLALANYLADKGAPDGFDVDLFGDGKIKAARECAQKPSIAEEDE